MIYQDGISSSTLDSMTWRTMRGPRGKRGTIPDSLGGTRRDRTTEIEHSNIKETWAIPYKVNKETLDDV